MATTVDQYIADLRNAIDEGRLQLDRDQFEQVTKPNYLNNILPTGVSNLTGMLMDRPDLYGSNAGKMTIDTLNHFTDARGIFLDDPRVPPELRGKNSLERDKVELASDIAKWNVQTDIRDFNASRSDADRTFAEATRARMAEESRTDRDWAMANNVPPERVIGGQIIPDYLSPHQQFAREFAAQNQGRLPGYRDLVQALAQQGRVPEDYNGGRPYAGQIPAAGPGILFDPGRGGYVDTVSGKVITNQQELAATVQQRQGQASQITGFDAQGQPIYALRPGVGVPGLGTNTGGMRQALTGEMTAGAGNPLMAGLQAAAGAGGLGQGPTAIGQPAMTAGLPGYMGPGAPTAGSATAAIGAGGPMSEYQRGLIEQGRATDVRDQREANAQRIAEKEVEYRQAIAQGNLTLANRTQDELTALNNAKLDLERQQAAFDQGIASGTLTGSYTDPATGQKYSTMDAQRLAQQDKEFGARLRFDEGVATGSVNGQQTVEAGALMGNFNGMSTLAGQQSYGGSALVGGGLTLEAQQALGRVGGQDTLAREAEQNKTSLAYLAQAADLSRNPADWVRYSTMLGGTPGGIRDIVDASAGRYNMARTGDYGTGSGGMQTVGGVAAGMGAAGQAGAQNQIAQARGGLATPGQLAPQQYQKMGTVQKQMLGGLYETGPNAMRAQDVEEMYRRSLPKYSGPRAGRVAA